MKIHTLDLNFQDTPHTIASYLVIGPDGPVLVECGPGSTLANLLDRLAEHDYQPSDVGHVLVTHIHLDHAGTAGWWAQQGAQVYVHHVGAPHLIDPTKLLGSAGRIYGEQMEPLWGSTVPAPAERVTAVRDGEVIDVCGLSFTAIDTPGHAYHHHVFRLGDIAFIGDAAGLQITTPAFPDLPAPPPEFNLELWLQTISLLRKQPFEAIYATHFGRIDDWRHHVDAFATLLTEAADFVRVRLESGLDRDEIVDQYRSWHLSRAKGAGVSADTLRKYEVANPLYMSVDGIIRYWKKRAAEH